MDAAPQFTHRVPVIDLKWRLRIAREDAGLEQSHLSNLIGISVRSIINYEKGYTTPRKPVLWAWALTTGVDPSWLAEGVEPEPENEGPDSSDGEVVENMRRTCFSDFTLVRGPDELPGITSVRPRPRLRVIS